MTNMSNHTPSPAERPFDPMREGMDWQERSRLDQVAAMFSSYLDLIPRATKHIGEPTRQMDHEGITWTVWEDPKYVFYATPGGEADLDVPEDVPPKKACEAFLWDMGALPKVLTRTEYAEWVEVGSALAEPHVELFKPYTQDQLKEFVLAYCDNQILCDHQIRWGDMAMVFMPMALGALSPEAPNEEKGTEGSPTWHAEQKLPEHPGDKPDSVPSPEPPEKPDYPDIPPEPIWRVVDPEVEAELLNIMDDSDVEVQAVADLFTEGESHAAADYRAEIEQRNGELRFLYERDLGKWSSANSQIDEDHAVALDDHDEAMRVWQVEEDRLAERVLAWERKKEINGAAHAGFNATRLRNLGVIYEYYSEAGPRCCNGYPCFFSCHIINKADWIRAHAAIVRELDRRENMEI